MKFETKKQIFFNCDDKKEDLKEKVWEKGKIIPGEDPNRTRMDSCGNVIKKCSYGKHSACGWEIDHKKPVNKGGSDSIRNLQPLHHSENSAKGDKYPYKKK